ncbi:hypothetical protein MMC18_005979 [Xylographa bjoerkii]|nr:hypothetical protein [Xylographa bjoerkii]
MGDSTSTDWEDQEESLPELTDIQLVVDPIKCKVGPDEALYLVPKALLVSRCPAFFGPALRNHFYEAQTNTLILPEEDPEIFEFFIHWVYQGAIPPLVAPHDSDPTDERAIAREATYHGLYCLAEKWLLKAFKNRVMDCIRASHTETDARIHPSLIENCYQLTPANPLLRRYIVESVAFVVKSSREKEYMEQLREQIISVDFPFDLLEKLSGLIDLGSFDNPNLKPDCDFHEATQGVQCCVVTNDFRGDKRLQGHFHKVFVMDDDLEED